MRHRLTTTLVLLSTIARADALHAEPPQTATRVYRNELSPIREPQPLLADHPEFCEPIVESKHFEAPPLLIDPDADLHVRAWRYSYNARGIIEIPNRLSAEQTALIMVHPWGIDSGQGWRTPEPAGVADFCTPEKNSVAARHTREIVRPFIDSLREHVACVMYSLPGGRDPIRANLYRSLTQTPTESQRIEAARQLDDVLHSFVYQGEAIPNEITLSTTSPVVDYFRQFPGLDAGPRYNNAGFWNLPIPVSNDVGMHADDIVIYDAEGYEPLKAFLQEQNIRHVLLTGYATDMCVCRTTAGYENLSRDFNVFIVGDATLATFPANRSPRIAVNAALSLAALNHLITQVSWVKLQEPGTSDGTAAGETDAE